MAENIDDISIAFYQDDRNVLHQLDKIVLTRGNWTTIMFLYQELNKKTNEYEAPKVSIRRYQKRGGMYKQQSKFNISSAKQGREISKILTNWYPEGKDQEFSKHHEPQLMEAPAPRPASTGSKKSAESKQVPESDPDDEITSQSDI